MVFMFKQINLKFKMSHITREVVDNGMSYQKYLEVINTLLTEGKTTGPKQSENLVQYTKLNMQRMHRMDKTTKLGDEIKQVMGGIEQEQIWVVLSEGWCGDAAINVPVISQIADLSDKVSLKLVLRDEHLEIMDDYLTNGGRAIPKLIAVDAKTLSEIFTWGPRPQPAQKMMMEYKVDNKGLSKGEFTKKIQMWYLKDKAQTLQKEFSELIKSN